MCKTMKQDIAKAFVPVKRRGKGFVKAIGRADPFKLFTPTWMFVFSLFIFFIKLFYISLKKIVGKYI